MDNSLHGLLSRDSLQEKHHHHQPRGPYPEVDRLFAVVIPIVNSGAPAGAPEDASPFRSQVPAGSPIAAGGIIIKRSSTYLSPSSTTGSGVSEKRLATYSVPCRLSPIDLCQATCFASRSRKRQTKT